jgi:hypothetical protein
MPVPDIRYITRTLARMVQEHMRVSPIWMPRAAPVVSPQPPDQSGGAELTLFLYHVGRDPALMTLPPPPPETAPHFAPLGLILNYQLTAHPQTNDIAGAEDAQVALSAAMLAFHEHALLSHASRPGGIALFNTVGIDDADVVLRTSMQPVSQAEAVGYWTPGDTPARLAVYYQVAAQLEPVDVTRVGPRVFAYGLGVFASGEPRLFAAESRLDLRRANGTTERVVLRPAEVPYGGRVTFIGGNLAGDEIRLVLESDSWADPVEVGAEWAVQVADGEVSATPAPTAQGRDVPPGTYRAKVQVTRMMTGGDGQPLTVLYLSNPLTFSITPQTDGLTGPDAAGIVTVTGRGFAPPGGVPGDAAMTLLGQPLTLGAGPNPGPGEFIVDSDTGLRFQADATTPPGRPLPVRVLIRGASAPPLWVTLP